MNAIKHLLTTIALLLWATITTGCSSDADDVVVDSHYREMVTVVSSDRTGGTVMYLYKRVSGERITLTARQYFDSNILKTSPRLMVEMTTQGRSPYDGGEVTLMAAAPVRPVKAVDIEGDDVVKKYEESAVLKIESVWLTGPWLNLRALTPNVTDATIEMAAVQNPEEADTLDLYLMLTPVDDNIYLRQYYWSALIDDYIVRFRPAKIRVHVNNPDDVTTQNIVLDTPISLLNQ